ncbi:MAG: hypothetical protein HY882_03965 [Deltaproteobacteria bacterium]|nr:hypothetical protein [Deltaproteobacteria bacterium]
MQAEIVLTPTESKKLITKSILQLKEFQSALEKGIVAMHPSSSTVFLYEKIMGRRPQGVWVCGVIAQKGLCGSREALEMIAARGPGIHDPAKSLQTWFFKKGALQEQTPLGEILDQMTASDMYIKGSNALDPQGNVGVLYANPAGGGGTVGKVIAAHRKKKFHLLLPIGLEKLIPVTIVEASKKAGFKKVEKAMGMPCGLIPVPGRKIDEVDAFKILSGARATPIAAGGLGGAEGSVVLALQGTEREIQKALEVTQTIKGAQLPTLNLPDCQTCTNPNCHIVRDREKGG